MKQFPADPAPAPAQASACHAWQTGPTLPVRRRQIDDDGTIKLLLELADGQTVECVSMAMPMSRTLCLSTQVGCPLACTFCQTGRSGFVRNLSSGEILGQARTLAREGWTRFSTWPSRCVFMGMGEPLLNFDALRQSLQILTAGAQAHLSWRKVQVSTIGIPHRLRELGQLRLALPAISLHAPTQELRDRLMPGAQKWPLSELIHSLRQYPLPGRERITVEYILIRDVNDSLSHAGLVRELLREVRAKINLIPCNPVPGSPWTPPDERRILGFAQRLRSLGMTVFLRRSLGPGIQAACGQLRAEDTPNRKGLPTTGSEPLLQAYP